MAMMMMMFACGKNDDRMRLMVMTFMIGGAFDSNMENTGDQTFTIAHMCKPCNAFKGLCTYKLIIILVIYRLI